MTAVEPRHKEEGDLHSDKQHPASSFAVQTEHRSYRRAEVSYDGAKVIHSLNSG